MTKMTLYARKLLSVVLCSSLAGCIGAQNVAKDYQVDPGTKKGLVIGTLTLVRSTYAAPMFRFRSVSETGAFKTSDEEMNSAIAFSENPITRRPRSDLPGRLAKLFVIELPEGKYNFHELRFPRGGMAGPIYIDMSSTSKHSGSFRAKAGQVVYVGDI